MVRCQYTCIILILTFFQLKGEKTRGNSMKQRSASLS